MSYKTRQTYNNLPPSFRFKLFEGNIQIFIPFSIPSFKTNSLHKMEQSLTYTANVITVARSGFYKS